MKEDRVCFITGSDEHGQKVQNEAKSRRKTPIEFADRMVGGFQNACKKLQISYDTFLRTTQDDHVRVVETVFEKLKEKGDIYLGEYEGWYCITCESFWPNSMIENRRCPRSECKQTVEQLHERGYFFKISNYQKQLLDHIEKNPDFIQPKSDRNEIISFIKNGLQDLCITRKGQVWGIPAPSDPDFTIYVWFDALLSYLSAAGYGEEHFNDCWAPDFMVIGKDMQKFHGIVLSAICLALEIPLPRTIFVQGWVISGGKRVSRSASGSVNVVEMVDEFGPDALRYYLLRDVPPGASFDFSTMKLAGRLNRELANDLGNLFSRSIAMVIKYCDGKIPEPGTKGAGERNLERIFKEVKNEYRKSMDKMETREALESLWDLVDGLNKYIVDNTPWEQYRNGNFDRLNTSLYSIMDYLRIVTLMCMPFMPRAAIKMWRKLGFRDALWIKKFDGINPDLMPPGQEVKTQSPLFPKVELS
jgi:methionyl-tRNA synthetase